jgi:hypothetical protein
MKKMPAKMAAFFEKKGEKKLAAHERREAKGKEKDTPAIAKREKKALKGAPKKLREYEKKEHKGKKYARGGGIESKGKTQA